MTRLLVSVRNVREARAALRGGAALLDIKEPARGSLGRAPPRIIARVTRAAAGRVPVSAALGELADWVRPPGCGAAAAQRRLDEALRGVQFVKWGLAGCRALRDWQRHWVEAVAALPPGARPVAVVYADWRDVGAPEPDEVIQRAAAVGCRAALLDTFCKDGRHLLQLAAVRDVRRFVEHARQEGLLAVVAGSLTLGLVPVLLEARPDYLAVRGAVCESGRTGCLQAHRVAEWVAALRGAHASNAVDVSVRLA